MRTENPLPGGRFLDEEDIRLHRRVAFIGYRSATGSCSARAPPVGETIRVARQHVRSHRRDEGEGAALELQPAGQVQCVFIPYTVGEPGLVQPYVGRLVWQAVDASSSRRPSAGVASCSASATDFNPTDERALRNWVRPRAEEDHRRHRHGPEDGARLHRRADARHRRRRHHEHHVRERAGAHARDRHPEGARRAPARTSCCSSCSRASRRASPAASSA